MRQSKTKGIIAWPVDDRPRERLLRRALKKERIATMTPEKRQ